MLFCDLWNACYFATAKIDNDPFFGNAPKARQSNMETLISDTSVLIDLERGHFLEATFRLSFEFRVPDLLYKRELKDYNGSELLALGLKIASLDSDGMILALHYKAQEPHLSLPDSFALALAKKENAILLAGDGKLRDMAKKENVQYHGLLWVLDRLEEQAIVSMEQLYQGLKMIADHPRCRLPKKEINIRLNRFTTK
ncbi:MAG: hypothetical protein DRR16_05280 [Candidatus Parabeggiatoa sp. nov. 3]|nr:MAG: hypothetical protein DRR00_19795 [Gammaproteobacteria bacterium]RKZ67612.1 MAG: hypothetical protein DRQ99_06150 [Gammaproteobacteria bacterium]RKZ88282.1 MAG: hypothetical protein DRR16_05280 [Gammaproteobacteria bacterium]